MSLVRRSSRLDLDTDSAAQSNFMLLQVWFSGIHITRELVRNIEPTPDLPSQIWTVTVYSDGFTEFQTNESEKALMRGKGTANWGVDYLHFLLSSFQFGFHSTTWLKSLFFFPFFFFFCHTVLLAGSYFPQLGIEPGPWLWKRRVLTMVLPGNSHLKSLFSRLPATFLSVNPKTLPPLSWQWPSSLWTAPVSQRQKILRLPLISLAAPSLNPLALPALSVFEFLWLCGGPHLFPSYSLPDRILCLLRLSWLSFFSLTAASRLEL